ncbi:MAG: Na+/H+ antiporter NhaA [Chlorobi bacterium]|nr:Na+/H+ antiporter NhaA [Chlorobiota bacterium]
MSDAFHSHNHGTADPFDRFIKFISGGSILLILAAVVAVVWANLDHKSYEHIWHNYIMFDASFFKVKMSTLHWINDGLMAIFFFVVGLEIKREFLAGELSSFRQAVFPIVAAIGGMIIPVVIFEFFRLEGEASHGWGIPMATDIAFSLGVLAILGKRVPLSLKVFLTALAIVDDLGAVVVIALFYGGQLDWSALAVAIGLLGILVVANRLKVQDLRLYTFVGFVIWYFFLMSGVDGPGTGLHATIAGVLVAFTIPARPKVDAKSFINEIKDILFRFYDLSKKNDNVMLTHEQLSLINEVEYSVKKVQSPLQYIENRLEGFVNLFILPVFALGNAGVSILGNNGDVVFTTVSFAIAFSLIVGKTIGITFFSWLAVKFKLAVKPPKTSWLSFTGVGILGGIGFTMSIFIAGLAYHNELLNQAKMGIFIGSIIAGVAGYLILKYSLTRDEQNLTPVSDKADN